MYSNKVTIEIDGKEVELQVALQIDHPVIGEYCVQLLTHWFSRRKIRATEANAQQFVNVFCRAVNKTYWLYAHDRYTDMIWNARTDKILIGKLMALFAIYTDIKIDPTSDKLPDVSHDFKAVTRSGWTLSSYINDQNELASFFKEDIYKEVVTFESTRKVASLHDVWDRMAYVSDKKDENGNPIVYCKNTIQGGFIPVLVKKEVIEALDYINDYKYTANEKIELFITENRM